MANFGICKVSRLHVFGCQIKDLLLWKKTAAVTSSLGIAHLREFGTSQNLQHIVRNRKEPKPIDTPIEYDYEKPKRVRSKIKIKLQDLENKPEKRENFFDSQLVQKIIYDQQMDKWMKLENGDMPVEGMPNPYANAPEKCILCRCGVELDYKNTRLLSQFVSPFTGRIMGRHITGLCVYMQSRVRDLIKRAQYFGFMPYAMKNPDYLKDPKLFDPFKRKL